MMEGALSLMQMAKICGALARLDRARLPYISVLTDPTTGGVTASFAMLGDLNIAEPKALIGFAGPRVIEQTIRQKLPEGFQRSEFLLENGMLDLVVDRREMKATIASALRFMGAARRRRPSAGRAGRERRVGRAAPPSAWTGRSRSALDYLFGLETVRHQVRARQHLARSSRALGHPERAFRSIHVAGTNGKGSVTAMVDAALRAAGHRSARYTSPHLVRPRRALRHRRPPVDDGDARSTRSRDVRDAVDELRSRRAASTAQPTFFEVTTAVAFELFRRARRRRRGHRSRPRRPARRHQRRDADGSPRSRRSTSITSSISATRCARSRSRRPASSSRACRWSSATLPAERSTAIAASRARARGAPI